jgi:DNA-binding transcriptional MerR regulator
MEKATKALRLREAGLTYEEIAQQLNLSNRGAAHNLVKRHLKRYVDEPAEEHLALELSRLDMLTRALSTKVAKGELGAIDRYLKVMERRAKYLGLDDFEARMAKVAERRAAVEEAQALLLATALAESMAEVGLSPSQRSALASAVGARMEAITAAPDPAGDTPE